MVGCFFKNSKLQTMKILIETNGQDGLSYEIKGNEAELSAALKVVAYYDTELMRALNRIVVERQIRATKEAANQDGSTGKTFSESVNIEP